VCRVRTYTTISGKTGRPVSKRVAPILSLKNMIGTMHLLLKSKSFERWPLSVRFFSPDVYKIWNLWSDRVPESIRSGIKVTLDPHSYPPLSEVLGQNSPDKASAALPTPPALAAFDVSYMAMKGHLAKSKLLLADENHTITCAVCHRSVDIQNRRQYALVCPHKGCTAVSHLSCLSGIFLEEEASHEQIVPLQGSCPSCQLSTPWSEMIKELSLRTTAASLVDVILDGPLARKVGGPGKRGVSSRDGSTLDEDGWFSDMYDSDDGIQLLCTDLDHVSELEDENDEHNIAPPSGQGEAFSWPAPQSPVGIVLDSEWDDVEVLE
jgi:structure-specific endonuclease subunit SLX1